MRPLWKDVLTALFMGMILPGILLNLAVMALEQRVPTAESAPQETMPEMVPLTMHLRTSQGTRPMDMDVYLAGVMLAEMPATFEEEALKAQSVAARTYAWKAVVTGGKHGDGTICTDAGCCQAYIAPEDYLEQGGNQEDLQKIQSAVASTSGQVLTYGDELIEATYFSCSGGQTEAAAAVWGVEFPYLQAQPSPGEENAAVYTDTVTFTLDGFQSALGILLQGDPASWFGIPTYTDGGGVDTLPIGDTVFTGTQLRSLLNLRSTAFTLVVTDDSVAITTRGYGHRVGMSQYGADAMAVSGKTYGQILAYYYPGTQLTQLSAEDS